MGNKFAQIKPLKRNGGRRFYRPQDLDILQQIKHLLYNQGYTIKGAKKAVDDFLNARSDQAVTSDDWIATIPPASVNDNFSAPHLVAESEPDLLSELADALAEPDDVSVLPSRETLSELRAELMAMREALLLHLPAISPVYQ